MTRAKIALAIIGLALLGIITRLAPHDPNVTAVGAIALIAGYYFPRRWAIVAPLIALFASDLMIGLYDWRVMLVVYASFVFMVLAGRLAHTSSTWHAKALALLGGSTIFFLTTNFAVWVLSDWYPYTMSGLIQCYTLALPFFRNSLIGDMGYGVVLFSAVALISSASRFASSSSRSSLPILASSSANTESTLLT